MRTLSKVSKAQRLEQAMTFIRLIVGAYFFWQGYQKFQDPLFSASLPSVFQHWAAQNPFVLYRDVLQFIAFPNAELIAWALPWVEMVIGASLVAGFLLHLTLPVAMLLNLNILLATQHLGAEALGLNAIFLGLMTSLYWCQAGWYYGLDRFLLKPGSAASSKTSGRTAKSTTARRKKPRPAEKESLDEDDEEAEVHFNRKIEDLREVEYSGKGRSKKR